MLRHNSELGVLTYDPQEPQLHSIVAYLDELLFVVPPTHPLAGEAQVSIRQLGAESFVAHIVSSPYREKVIQAFKRHKTPLHMDIELPTLQAIKRFVAMGNGVALLPAISVESELARGELVHIPVRELRLHRKLRLVYRQAASLSHAARAFLKVAEAFSRRAPRSLPLPTRALTPQCGRERPRSCGSATNHVGTAALGCPVEQSSTDLLPPPKNSERRSAGQPRAAVPTWPLVFRTSGALAPTQPPPIQSHLKPS